MASIVSVTTEQPINLTGTSMTMSGRVCVSYNSMVYKGFYFGSDPSNLHNYTRGKSFTPTGCSNFHWGIYTLNDGSKYYCQFWAKLSGSDRKYGDLISFIADEGLNPITLEVSSQTENSAKLNGSYITVRDRMIKRYFFWGITKELGRQVSLGEVYSPTGDHSSSTVLSGLVHNQVYFYQFAVKLGGGIIRYGEVLSFIARVPATSYHFRAYGIVGGEKVYYGEDNIVEFE